MTDDPASRPLRTFGRRRGHRLRQTRSALVDSLLPVLRLPADDPIDPDRLFPTPKRALWLEIGFGGGEHLAAQAAAHPEVGFIGCEVYVDGVGSLLRHVESQALDNIRLHDDDARDVLKRLPDACLDRIYLLFPDPWPKARHHKRRFVSLPMLDALARVLADEGLLVFASDHAEYARWTLERATRHADLSWLARSPADWARPADWIETRYESKALAAGSRCIYLRFERRSRPLVS